MNTREILERLIAFPTVSRTSNRALIDYVAGLLDGAGIPWELAESPDGTRANLFATLGPADRPGVVLSGHSDVVPAEGQAWSRDPFTLCEIEGRLYGRGTADMKGFVAAALAAMLRAAKGEKLKNPLHLALSYDEEIGCVGVRGLIEALKSRPLQPAYCLVGEPTRMRIASGHKGKVALRACCQGRAGHSALAPDALNALHLGADFLNVLRVEQARLAREGAQDPAYEIPYSTVHAGVMSGGRALNIVPDQCQIDFEIRNLAADDPAEILARIEAGAKAVIDPLTRLFPEAAIAIEEVNAYPGLDTLPDAEVVGFFRRLADTQTPTCKVAFGTEAGLFSQILGIPSVICGPGDMAQGHKPDEYIEISQLEACDRMLDNLLGALRLGL